MGVSLHRVWVVHALKHKKKRQNKGKDTSGLAVSMVGVI